MNKLSTGQMRTHSQMSHHRLHSRTNMHLSKSNIGSAYQAELAEESTPDLET